jgi:CspA family cold shock protein
MVNVMSVKNHRVDDRVIGTVVKFRLDRGYGFVRISENEPDIFVHYKNIEPDSEGFKKLAVGDTVEFTVVEDQLGLTAFNVKIIKTAYRSV